MGIEIERFKGSIIRVGTAVVKTTPLPDWYLDFIEFPPNQMKDYRSALTQAKAKIVRVTEKRIYFEQ